MWLGQGYTSLVITMEICLNVAKVEAFEYSQVTHGKLRL